MSCEHSTFFEDGHCTQCKPKRDAYKNKNKMEWVAVSNAVNFKPMLALEDDHLASARFPARVELKYDGIRAIVTKLEGAIRIQTRGGHDYTRRYPSLCAYMLKNLPLGVYDGELYFPSRRGEKETLRYKNEDLIKYAIYDLPLFARAELLARRVLLEQMEIPVKGRFHLAEGWTAANLQQAEKIVGVWLVAGFEGGVIKPLDSQYYFGQRKEWVKIKNLSGIDPESRKVGMIMGLKKMMEEFA